MTIADIIKEALIQYDTAQIKIRFLEKNMNLQRENNLFIFSGVKPTLVTEVEHLATYDERSGNWIWEPSKTRKQILLYAQGLEDRLSYIKSILIPDKSIISNPIQIDINLAIYGSVSKKYYIYPITESDEIHYYVLLNSSALDTIK